MTEVTPSDISPDRAKHVEEFLQEYVMSINKKRTKQLLAMSNSGFEAFKLSVRVSRCCRSLDLDKAYQFYLETRAMEVVPNETTYSNLLSLVAGLGEQGSGQSIIRMTEPPHNIDAAFVVYNDMKENSIPLNESNYSALIRCCSIHHRSQDAMKLYNDLKACNVTPKLRSFTPLLSTFGRDCNVEVCKQIWQEMTQQYNIPATEKEYCIMLRLCVSVRDRTLFYETFEAFREDIPQPCTTELVEIVTDFFQAVESGFTIAHSLVTPSGIVEFNGEQLLSIDMEPETRQQLLSQLDTFAVMRDEVNRKFKPNNKIKELLIQKKNERIAAAAATTTAAADGDESTGASTSAAASGGNSKQPRNAEADDAARRVKWDQFKAFLAARQFDVIVDGANVGYYKQNYVGAPSHVDYAQIDQMVRHLISLGRKPLLILHCRHLHPNMVPNNPKVHAIIRQWESEGFMYSTPKGFNDDWFWLYVAVAYQCKVVTNDEMRDHHFQMLAPRWFSRWKERNQAHFDFTHCPRVHSFNSLTKLEDEASRGRDSAEIVIDTPDAAPAAVVTATASEPITSSGAGDAAGNSSGKFKYKFVNKVITLHWPAPYSHRVQHIVSDRYEGFYIPPPPRTNNGGDDATVDGDEKSGDESDNHREDNGENEEDNEGGAEESEVEAGGSSGVSVGKGVTESGATEEEDSDEGDAGSELWSIFYRPVVTNEGGSNKRERADVDTATSGVSPNAKHAKY